MRLASSLLAVLVISGCASTPTATPVAAATPTVVASADAPAQVCHREFPMGSNIPKTVCEAPMTEAQRAQGLNDTQNALLRALPTRHASGN